MSYFTILGSKYVGRGDYEQQVYYDRSPKDSNAELALKNLEKFNIQFPEEIPVKEKQEGTLYGPWPDGSFVLEFIDDVGNKEMYSASSLDKIKDLYLDINFKSTESPLIDYSIDKSGTMVITPHTTKQAALDGPPDALESKTHAQQDLIELSIALNKNAMEVNEELKESFKNNKIPTELKNFFFLTFTRLFEGIEYKPHVPARIFDRIKTDEELLSVIRPLSFLAKKLKHKDLKNEKWKFKLPVGTVVGHSKVIDTFLAEDMIAYSDDPLKRSLRPKSRLPLSIHTDEPEEEEIIPRKEKVEREVITSKHSTPGWQNKGGVHYLDGSNNRIFAVEYPEFISVFVGSRAFKKPIHLSDFETLPPKDVIIGLLKKED